MKPPSSKAGKPREPVTEIIAGCSGVCDRNINGDCRKCGRIQEEIEQWHTLDNQARGAVMRLARHRLSMKLIDP